MRRPPINPNHEKRPCEQCGTAFEWKRRKQRFCHGCHSRYAYKPPKWVVTRVVPGMSGGYAFSVSVVGAPAVGGFFMQDLGSFIRFPRKLCVSPTKRARLFKSLQRQVAKMVKGEESELPFKIIDRRMEGDTPVAQRVAQKQDTVRCQHCGKPIILGPPEKREDGSVWSVGYCKDCRERDSGLGDPVFKQLSPPTKKRCDVHLDCKRGPNQICTADYKNKKFSCTGCGEVIDFTEGDRVKPQWIDLPLPVSQIPT